jgi:hypothetical protein
MKYQKKEYKVKQGQTHVYKKKEAKSSPEDEAVIVETQ